MSHRATNWALQQRGIKPAMKIVLWHLCDCHNPSMGGTFPSQEYLSEQCEIPRSTLNTYLDALEQAGLIAREQRRQPGSKRQERTRYFFPFEEEFSRFRGDLPSPETGHGSDEAESRKWQKPSPENGESRVQNLDSNPVREPVIEPVNLFPDAGVPERSTKVSAEDFVAFWDQYPHKVGKRDAEKAFSAARRRVGQADLMAGLALYAGKADDRPWCNPATWLNQDRWADKPAPPVTRSRSPPPGQTPFQQRQQAAMAAIKQAQQGRYDDRKPAHSGPDIDLGPRDFRHHRDPSTER